MLKLLSMSIFSLFLFCNFCFCNKKLTEEISRVLKLHQDSGYNKDVRPDYGGMPIIVNMSVHIKDISSVSEVEMDFKSDFFLRQTWNDDRLAFNETNGLKQLIVGADFIKKIWIPDTYLVNSKETSLHTSTNLETNSFLRIKPNGDVYYSLRVTVVSVCQMNLRYFPMDTQICEIQLESYGYSTDELEYNWIEPQGTTFDDDISLPNFNIIGHSNQKTHIIFTSGNYSRLLHRIIFSRSMGYYLNQVYVPAIFIVVISWIPFWLDRDDNHARVGLGVTTVLTMTTLVTNTNAAMPKISYMKSLDIYLEVCFAMVFASLMQYAVVGYFTAKNRDILHAHHNSEHYANKMSKESDRKSKRSPNIIDLHSRWVFPLIYLLFNLFYWSIYLYLSQINFCNQILKNQ